MVDIYFPLSAMFYCFGELHDIDDPMMNIHPAATEPKILIAPPTEH